MLSGLRSSDRRRLLASIGEVQATLDPHAAPGRGELVLRGLRPGDLGWAIARHGEIYAEEFGWDVEFEAFVATLFGEFAKQAPRPGERLWIAEIDGERVGVVFVVRNAEDPDAAQLRCLLVDPKARGKGVGKRLVDECVQFARGAGYRKMILWTNDVLVAARRIYEAAGFKLIAQENHHSFGKELVGQTWSMEL
jgi:GNAT superfamily N-acetyltransferase